MIRTINVISPSAVEALRYAPTAAIILIETPGQELPWPGGVRHTLMLEFDSLESELELGAEYGGPTREMVSFDAEHARAIVGFAYALQRTSAPRDLYIVESQGDTRATTVGRWIALEHAIPSQACLLRPDVRSCRLMDEQMNAAAEESRVELGERVRRGVLPPMDFLPFENSSIADLN